MKENNDLKNGFIFIGMSGSGKTTLGRKFSQEIGYQFVDSDHLIEDQKKLPLQEIVDGYLDKRDFIFLERSVIEKIILKRTVLSTGGSICYSNQVLKKLSGTIIFLKISWNELKRRIKNFSERGMVWSQPTIEKEYDHRQPLYEEVADLVINCDGKSIKTIIQEIKFKTGFFDG